MHNYEKLYERLMNCKWFERCGNKDDVFKDFNYIWAENIVDVDKNINSIKWENICLEEKNELFSCLYNQQELLNLWAGEVNVIKEKYVPDIIERVKQANEKYSLPESVIIDVQSIIQKVFICDFYSEQYHSEFYENLLEIYLSGHLPCGYKGRYRKGSIIIY